MPDQAEIAKQAGTLRPEMRAQLLGARHGFVQAAVSLGRTNTAMIKRGLLHDEAPHWTIDGEWGRRLTPLGEAVRSHLMVGVKVRRYCWRAGLVVESADGEKCPECNSVDHRPVEPAGSCGAFSACGPDHGHPCEREAGHDGPHECAPCGSLADGVMARAE